MLKGIRLQSAMEYLTTYGWSVLVIGIVIVSLFAFGVFGANGTGGSTCTSQAGFLCTKPILNSSGLLNISFGSAGSVYNINWIGCSNASAPPQVFKYIPLLTLVSGQKSTLNFQCNLGGSSRVGSGYTGTLWVQYVSPGLIGVTKIGSVSAKVSTGSPVGGNPPKTLSSLKQIAIANGPGISDNSVWDVAVTPDGSQAVVDSINGNLITINLASNTVTSTLYVGGGGFTGYGIAITPNETEAVNPTGSSGNVIVVNLLTHTIANIIAVGSNPAYVAITPNGATALVTNIYNGNVIVNEINLATDTLTGNILIGPRHGTDTIASGITVTSDGTMAAESYENPSGTMQVAYLNLTTNKLVGLLGLGGMFVYNLATIPNTHQVVVSETESSVDAPEFFVLNMSSNSIVMNYQIAGACGINCYAEGIAVSPSGTEVLVGIGNFNFNTANTIVWNLVSNTVSSGVTLPALSVPYGVAVNPTGKGAVVADDGVEGVSILG